MEPLRARIPSQALPRVQGGSRPGPRPAFRVSEEDARIGVHLPKLHKRPPGRTSLAAVVRVLRNDGLVRSATGSHQQVVVSIEKILGAGDESRVNSKKNVTVFMRLADDRWSDGLRQAISLKPGDDFMVSGEFIPKDPKNGQHTAVLHMTHAIAEHSFGAVVVNGRKFE